MKSVLTPTAVAHAKARERVWKLFDGGGLHVRILPSGAKSWCYSYRLAGRQHTFTIGSYPEISLKHAREAHRQARAVVADGEHPLQHRRRQGAHTFEAVARDWIARKQVNWSDAYRKQVCRVLEADAFPALGHKPIGAVTAQDVLGILEAVANRTVPPGKKQRRARGAVTVALLIRQLCSGIMKFAVARRLAAHDVAADLQHAIVRPRVRNNPGLSAEELPALVAAIDCYGARNGNVSPLTAPAIELLMLTLVRTGELRGARWVEIDWESRLWTIPAARMKMGRDHLVPLPVRALELLASVRQQGVTGGLVFPNRRDPGRPISATTINRALEYMGFGGKLSAHGLRSTASTLLHEAGFAPHLIEKQLAHESRNRVAGAYNKAEYLDQRREMLEFWSDFVRNKARDRRN